jgi:hypothetical protein
MYSYFPTNYTPRNYQPVNYWPLLAELVEVGHIYQPRESQGGGTYYYKPISSIFDNEEDKPTVKVDKESEEVIILKMIKLLEVDDEYLKRLKASANEERQIIELINNLASIKTYDEKDDEEALVMILSLT